MERVKDASRFDLRSDSSCRLPPSPPLVVSTLSMQAQASRTDQHQVRELHFFLCGTQSLAQAVITSQQSLQSIQTLLRAGLGCITYLRYEYHLCTLHNMMQLNPPLGISCLRITSPRVSRSVYARNTLDRTHILGYLTSSGPESLSSQPTNSGSSFASSDGRKNVSGFKIMTVTRGFTEEADKLLDYLVSSVGYISSSE